MGRSAHDAIDQRQILFGKVHETAAGIRKVKGKDFQLSGSSSIQGSFVGKNVIFHVGHGGTAQNQHQSGSVLISVNQHLERGSQAFVGTGDIRIFINDKDKPFLFRQSEYIFHCGLKRREDSVCRNSYGVFQDTSAEVFQILLQIALHPHKVDCFSAFYELVNKGCFSHTPASINDGEFKFIRSI